MKLQSLTGMRDLFEEDLKLFQKIEKSAQEILDFYGFRKIETPILEMSELFERGSGQSSEIVQKQMFSFRSKGGDFLSLRPDYTPSIMRAYFQHGMDVLPKPVNLWYSGSCFRYEKPQAGRYRQFYQLGIEVLGSESWITDTQVVYLFFKILETIGLNNLIIKINTIGDSQCRPYYKKTLSEYLRRRRNSLCADCKNRLKLNPLRVLDCKEEKCQVIKKEAPQLLNHLCGDCHKHFEKFLEGLDELSLPYNLDPYLVRGLDYYTRTVFEIFKENSEENIKQEINEKEEKEVNETKKQEEKETQIALGGGGRYDNLAKLFGWKETPAVGFGFGLDRIIGLIKKTEKKELKLPPVPRVFLAQVGELAKKKCLGLLEKFRKEKIRVAESLFRDSLGLQLKIADKLGVRYVLILGQKEVLEEKIIIRDMKTGKQAVVNLKKAIKEIKKPGR